MSRSEGDRDLVSDGLADVAALAREVAAPMTPLQRMRGLEAVTRRAEGRRRKRRALTATAMLAAGGLVAAGAIGLFVARGGLTRGARRGDVAEPNPISYRVENGEIGDGGYLRAFEREADRACVALRFAEGTELRLAAGARGRLTSVDGQGARFAIEQGEAQVSVAHRAGARWLIDAGPFLITVHGTVFSASWDGSTERLDIEMKRGLVSVTGPVADGGIAVHAGQRLTINVRNREVLLRPSEAAQKQDHPEGSGDDGDQGSTAAGATAAAKESAAAPEAPPVVEARSRANAPSRTAATRATPTSDAASASEAATHERRWTTELASGDFQGVLREAEHHGLPRSLAEARSEDLAALADAARYLRRDDIARQALVAQRDRFPRSERAREAAFLLGRLMETGGDGDVRALSWYDRYLAEAPSGAYAAEALGRQMTAIEKLRGPAAARDIARDYLRRFPHGTYAGAAQALSETP